MHRTLLVALAAVVSFSLLSMPPQAPAADPAAKCAAKKRIAAGKVTLKELICHAKAVKKGIPLDDQCIANANAKLIKKFGKAEAAGGCLTSDDTEAIATEVDTCVSVIVDQLPGAATTTTTLPPGPCGNDTCESGEEADENGVCGSCPLDCGGNCCGDSVCDASEDRTAGGGGDEPDFVCGSCTFDCTGSCCGDGVCDPGNNENLVNCGLFAGGDCFCGDGICSPPEDAITCFVDCSP